MTTTLPPVRTDASAETVRPAIGSDRMRVDAPLKVTGSAPYAYEQPVEEPTYLFPLVSTIARGRITRCTRR